MLLIFSAFLLTIIQVIALTPVAASFLEYIPYANILIGVIILIGSLGSLRQRSLHKEFLREKAELEKVIPDLQAKHEKEIAARKEAEKRAEDLEIALKHEKTKALASSQQQSGSSDALMLLDLLQGKGRLIDFLMEDITPYDDSRVAAVARFVHQGCADVLKNHADIKPLVDAEEGASFEVPAGYDPSQIRLIGKAISAPCKGTLVHRGWKTSYLKLPKRVQSDDSQPKEMIIAPTEIEI